MAIDETYQTKVYNERGGNATVIKSDGILEVASLAQILFGSNIAYGDRIVNYLMGRGAVTIIGTSLTELSDVIPGDSVPPILPSRQGYIFFSFLTGSATQTSCRLHSAYIGEELVIMMRGEDAGAYISIALSGHGDGLSGVSVQGYSNNASILTCIMMYNSASAYPVLKLLGVANGTWAIVGTHANSSDGSGGVNDVIVEQVE